MFNSCEKFLNYANSRYRSSWQLFRKFAFFGRAWLILCVKTLIKMFRSWQFGSWTWKAIHGLFLSNPKWKEVCVNKWQLNTRWCVNKALVAFVLWLVFRILLASFFFTACLWMFIASWILELNKLLVIRIYSQGVFFCLKLYF